MNAGWLFLGGSSAVATDSVLPLHVDGKIFRLPDGMPERIRMVSGFKLQDRFVRGESIEPFRNAYPLANTVRIFNYVTNPPWTPAWDVPTVDHSIAFIRACGALGWRVFLTLLTDDASWRIPQAQAFVQGLSAARADLPNLLLQIGNEPATHKNIDVDALKAVCEASGFLYSCGRYEDEQHYFGSFGSEHPVGAVDWYRRGHELMEWFTGDGPEESHPPVRIPWIADETTRPDSAVNDPASGRNKVANFRAFGASLALFGAGGCFHCQSGKWASLPNEQPNPDDPSVAAVPDEGVCRDAFFEGMTAFPADASLGGYRHVIEANEPYGARTYVIGERYMVRCGQLGTSAPEAGWTPIDADGVLFQR